MKYSLMNRNYWSPRFTNEMGTLFDDFWPAPIQKERNKQPVYEVTESDEGFLLTVELPGVSKENLKIEVNENLLSISGQRSQHFSSKRFSEEAKEIFAQSFSLASVVDVDKIEAHLQDGVLHIVVPKQAAARPRQIKVSETSTGLLSKLLGESKKREEVPTYSDNGQVA